MYNKLLQNAVTDDVSDINVSGCSGQAHKGRKIQHLISPTLTFYDDITAPGNSHSNICAFLCVCLVSSALSKLERWSQHQIQPDGDFFCDDALCVWMIKIQTSVRCHIKCRREAVLQSVLLLSVKGKVCHFWEIWLLAVLLRVQIDWKIDTSLWLYQSV